MGEAAPKLVTKSEETFEPTESHEKAPVAVNFPDYIPGKHAPIVVEAANDNPETRLAIEQTKLRLAEAANDNNDPGQGIEHAPGRIEASNDNREQENPPTHTTTNNSNIVIVQGPPSGGGGHEQGHANVHEKKKKGPLGKIFSFFIGVLGVASFLISKGAIWVIDQAKNLSSGKFDLKGSGGKGSGQSKGGHGGGHGEAKAAHGGGGHH
jgi:hypothetical protein